MTIKLVTVAEVSGNDEALDRGSGVSIVALAKAFGCDIGDDLRRFCKQVSSIYNTVPGMTNNTWPGNYRFGTLTPIDIDEDGNALSDRFILLEDAIIICRNVNPSFLDRGRDIERALIGLAVEKKGEGRMAAAVADHFVGETELKERVFEITEAGLNRRLNVTPKTKKKHAAALGQIDPQGICPCCGETKILDDDGQSIRGVFEIDHFFSRTDNAFEATWPVCRQCNIDLRKIHTFKRMKIPMFYAYHEGIAFPKNGELNLVR